VDQEDSDTWARYGSVLVRPGPDPRCAADRGQSLCPRDRDGTTSLRAALPVTAEGREWLDASHEEE